MLAAACGGVEDSTFLCVELPEHLRGSLEIPSATLDPEMGATVNLVPQVTRKQEGVTLGRRLVFSLCSQDHTALYFSQRP